MSSQTAPTNKSLGQHWLFDEPSLEAMAEAAQVQPGDVVLEVGPGLGTLTEVLLKRGAHVVAVEFDKALAAELHQNILSRVRHFETLSPRHSGLDPESSKKEIADENSDTTSNWILNQVQDDTLSVVNEDILQFDLTQLPKHYKVCANIPYYLTSNLIRRLLESSNPPSVMALLVQKEVAERIAAEPGRMSILSVSVQFYAQASLGTLVPAVLFTPPPKVDSQIVSITRRQKPLFPDIDTKQFFHIVKAGFSEKRKKLRSSLSGGLQLSKQHIDELLTQAHIPADARAQELSLEQWYQLYIALNT